MKREDTVITCIACPNGCDIKVSFAEDGSIAMRVTQEEVSKQICYRFQKAIVSTSANISGEPAPGNFQEISEEIKNAVDYIVSARRKEKTKAHPSSIIKLGCDGEVKIIRK